MKQEIDIERLFKGYYEKMYNLARCILYDDDECRDVVSDVFTKLLTERIILLPEIEEHYLMRCVRNRCLNVIAHKNIKIQVEKLLLIDAQQISSEKDDEQLDQLMQIIKELEPPIRQQILRLRFLKELSYQDIAEYEGVSKVTVYNHLSQAVDFIRKQFLLQRKPCIKENFKQAKQ